MIDNPSADYGQVIWRPSAETIANAHTEFFAAFARERGAVIDDGYGALWRWSVAEPETFWSTFVEWAGIRLGGEPGPVTNGAAMPKTRWFPGRTVNFARYLLDGRDGVAIIAVSEDGAVEEWSFDRLRGEVGALATRLRALGVVPGDRVVAVLPNVPEAMVGLLAAASIGAVWSICSPEFGPGAIVSRFQQLDPKVVLAAPGYRLGGKDRDRSAEMAEVLSELPAAVDVIWVTHRCPIPTSAVVASRGVDWQDVIATPDDPDYLDVEFSHPLWVLFSSGTTGIPKGIVHGHGGALVEELQMLCFGGDLKPGDRYFSVASTSWVVWNSLVSSIGVGATPVLLDGNPTFPSLDNVWKVAAATNAAVLGVGAGFVHACGKAGLTPRADHDLSRLREVQVTGSPLSSDGFRWVYQHVGDVWLVSMSGGTDIAGCFVGGAPTEPVRVGYIQAPALGVKVEAWDESGLPTSEKGELVVTAPMPSMPLYFWNDDDGARYRSSYFDTYPGVWRHGDFIEISDNGIQIHGRSDSTLNRNGIRLGSADIYAVVEPLPEVAEAMVVGAEIGLEGYYMPLFIQLSPGADEATARAAVEKAIRTKLSVRYLPDELVIMPGIPHTKTGKKLEVPMKRMLQGSALAEVADLDAVDDAGILEQYAAFAATKAQTLSAR